MVAESMDYIATELEKAVAGGKTLNAAIQELLPKIIRQHKKVIFNGDNYTEEWHSEAQKRGLPNLKSTTDCLPVLQKKETIDLLTKYKVYSAKELESRFNILSETYVKTISIEANMMLTMAKTMILPAALRYQREVGESIAAAKAAGANSPAGLETFGFLVSSITDFQRNISALEKATGHHAEGSPFDHAKHAKEHVVPAMAELRKAGDKLETIVADDLWPLPTYREMLFIK
jgi:glutamine synthetase